MENNNKLSLSDSDMLREDEKLLNLLLKDHTTGKNIKWGTDSYINHGYSFRYDQEIKIDLITGWYEDFIRPRVDKDIDVQLERQRNKAEVFTPSWVIKLQVEAALEDMKELPLADFIQTKWLEITCGEAPYMVNRYDMETGEVIPLKERSGFIDVKFKKLNQEIESEEEWLKLAVEIYKASYGYEYQGDSLLLARENLILTFIDNYFYMFGAFPKDKLLLEITKIISLNVFQMDGLTYEVPYSDGGTGEFGTQLSLFEEIKTEEVVAPKLARLKSWSKNKSIEFKELSERKNLKMKFDVVIGNPPYQAETIGNNKTYSPPVYHDFLEGSYSIADKSIMIHPARFLFNAGSTPKQWNNKMLNDPHLKVLHYEADSKKIFNNTDIKGGIAITYRDKYQKNKPIETFIPWAEMINVLEKVKSFKYTSLSKIVYAPESYKFSEELHKQFPEARSKMSKGHAYGVMTNIFNTIPFVFSFTKLSNIEEFYRVYGRHNHKRVEYWIKRELIEPHENLKYYKLLLPKSNGSGNFGEALSDTIVAKPNEIHTQTYMSFGKFETEDEVINLDKYIKTKFVRSLLSTLKITQDLNNS